MSAAAGRLLGLPRAWTLALVPLVVIAGARIAAHSPLALAYPRSAALLLVWIVADSLMLSQIARARPALPDKAAVLAALAAAILCAILVMPAPLRAGLLAMPAAAALMALPVAAHLAWGIVRARRAWRAAGEERALAALSELAPRPLARFALAEARLLHLALFRWRGEPDVPPGAAAFPYHAHLAPIVAVVIALQAIEVGAMHLLIGLWSAKAALILSLLGAAALVYLVGLLKSFRLMPVLVDAKALRVRTGILIDRRIPLARIARVRTSFASEEVRHASCVEAGLLAWPNILVELDAPIPDPGRFRPDRVIEAIAFRLDDPAAFVRLLEKRLGERD